MQNTNPNIKIVYKMQYAIKMKLLGHKMLTQIPNPKDNNYKCWVFEDDQSFDSDLSKLIKEGKNHG